MTRRDIRGARRFPARMWRLYRYFRGDLTGTIYYASGYGCSRSKAMSLAWRYARKGAGQYV